MLKSPSLKYRQFQSTLPMKGATERIEFLQNISIISIHTPYEGSDEILENMKLKQEISIHTPYEGSDWSGFRGVGSIFNFNPHSL